MATVARCVISIAPSRRSAEGACQCRRTRLLRARCLTTSLRCNSNRRARREADQRWVARVSTDGRGRSVTYSANKAGLTSRIAPCRPNRRQTQPAHSHSASGLPKRRRSVIRARTTRTMTCCAALVAPRRSRHRFPPCTCDPSPARLAGLRRAFCNHGSQRVETAVSYSSASRQHGVASAPSPDDDGLADGAADDSTSPKRAALRSPRQFVLSGLRGTCIKDSAARPALTTPLARPLLARR